jgi:hypothetical protein
MLPSKRPFSTYSSYYTPFRYPAFRPEEIDTLCLPYRCSFLLSQSRLRFRSQTRPLSRILLAHLNSSARMPSPRSMTRTAGPGRTTIARPAASTTAPAAPIRTLLKPLGILFKRVFFTRSPQAHHASSRQSASPISRTRRQQKRRKTPQGQGRVGGSSEARSERSD